MKQLSLVRDDKHTDLKRAIEEALQQLLFTTDEAPAEFRMNPTGEIEILWMRNWWTPGKNTRWDVVQHARPSAWR